MQLLIALITYNRLNSTKKTLRYLWDNTELPYKLIIIDNNSSDGTQDYLKSLKKRQLVDEIILNPDNYYPGKATNIGWKAGTELFKEITHLVRLDNDMELHKGWDVAVEGYFKAIPELGQLGLDHEAIEDPKAKIRELEINGKTINPWPGCVGGPCVIPKRVWSEGARWPETRWDDGRDSPLQEDSQFSRIIQNMGYLTGHATDNLSRTFANPTNWHEDAEYYRKTMTERGYLDRLKQAGLDEG